MAAATGVAINSIAVVGNVVTVTTASAHGLVANQGFSLRGTTGGSNDYNSTVATVPLSTTFTFNTAGVIPAPVNQGGAGGNAFPARRAVLLNVAPVGAIANQLNYIIWLTTANPIAASSASSQWTGASTAEINALRSGYTIERFLSKQFAVGVDLSHAEFEIQNDVIAQQNALQNAVAPAAVYGVWLDSGWSA